MRASHIVFVFARVGSVLLVSAVIRNDVGMAGTLFEVFWHSSCSNNERCDVVEASTGWWRVVNCQGQCVGVLEEECKRVNEIFMKYITSKKPFVNCYFENIYFRFKK